MSTSTSLERATMVFLAMVLAALACVVAPVRAHAELPPQVPGVTLRTYDLQVALSKLCPLKPATPNVDKLMPAIDWTSDADFGINDKFFTQAIAHLNIKTAGSYAFRLTSDDGSQLSIDGNTVIDHDGLHAVSSKEGTVHLTAGYHDLLVEHFDALSGQRLKLEWWTPGSSQFELVPTSVLSSDKPDVPVISGGRKYCVGGATPGDDLALDSVHPNYTLTNLRPEGFEPKVTGMDWLPDGRLAISTWGGKTDSQIGEVYLVSNVTGDTSPEKVKYQKIASGLWEPGGIKYVDGKLYVVEKRWLVEMDPTDTNGDEKADNERIVAKLPFSGPGAESFHEFAFGLVYQDGYFYLNLAVNLLVGGYTRSEQPVPNRGTTLKVSKKGEVEAVAGGLRTPNGIGLGPEGGIFVADNQGSWLPASKLVQIKPGRFFNEFTNPDGRFDTQPVAQPVLWLPHNDIGRSPSNPVLLNDGPFAGQMLFGDVTYGGLQRAFLEKVNGEYQGAAFRHTQGLEAGVGRTSIGPDGAIYVGGIGSRGNWGQEGKNWFGLQKLTPNGKNAFDIKAMRVMDKGFELEYTQPLSAETAKDLAGKYVAEQWRYAPSWKYGGEKTTVDQETLKVSGASLSADRKKVRLWMSGLKPGRVVHVRSPHTPRPFTAESGQALWSTEAWYTLNSTYDGATQHWLYEAESAKQTGFDVEREKQANLKRPQESTYWNNDHAGYTGDGFSDGFGTVGAATTFAVNAASTGTHDVTLRYSNGPHPFEGTKTLSVYVNGKKVRQTKLASTGNWDTWATKTEPLSLKAGANTIAYKYDSGDTGHVNLDQITVYKRPDITPTYQAESAALAGSAGVNIDHPGYSGTGFVDSFRNAGTSATFSVNVASAGSYDVALRYSNGPNPFTGTKTVSLYVNGKKVKQVGLDSTAAWAKWATKVTTVDLKAGANEIAFKRDDGDNGHVNLDYITVQPEGTSTYQAESAAIASGAGVNIDHSGYSGAGFVDGFGHAGASATFSVNAASAGSHNVALCYSNGPNPFTGTKTVSLYVNDKKVKQVRLTSTGDWDTWATQVEAVDLKAGANKIALKYDGGDTGHVNLDYLAVAKAQRVTLFDGTNLNAWQNTSGGAANWPVANGSMESSGGNIRTKQTFGDFKLHAEWYEPNYPTAVTGQARGNSGVYLQERYEIQVLDSFGDTSLANNEAGAIYNKRAPDKNMATAPGTWQTYDIVFRAARYDSAGKKIDNARVTVTWNGQVVHKDVAIDGGTGGNIPEGPTSAAIRLQDHGDPGENPRFRNIWIEPIA